MCCSFQHSLVYGQSCLLLSRWTLFMHCVLWLSQLSSALCWRLLMWVWSRASRVVFTRKNGQLWAGQRWSDMNNMYGWLAENTCRGAGRLHLMALCISYLSPRAHSEGGLGIGMRGSGWMLLHVRAFGWVSRLALASFISQLVWSKAFTGGAFASADRSPVMFA